MSNFTQEGTESILPRIEDKKNVNLGVFEKYPKNTV